MSSRTSSVGGTVVALGFNLLIAHAAREVRPYVAHPHVLVLVPKANDFAFPSDHSIVAGGLTLSVLLVLGAVLRRPARGSTGGRAAPEPAAHSAPSVPSRP